MPVERIEAHPRVRSDVGRVALQRGPLVYCLEGVDNGAKVRHLALPRQAELRAIHQPELLGGVTTVTGQALAQRQEDWRDWTGRLYRPSLAVEPVAFTAVPYYAWDNRAAGEMVVWLPEAAGLVEPPPVAGRRVTASHMHSADTPLALYDRVEPISSQDNGLPRFSWWSHRGTAEWVAYDFDRARRVSSVAVYWFDDQREGGSCRVPASWHLLYRVGEDWKEVGDPSTYGTQLNQFNQVTFSPVEAEALKIEVQLQPEFSAGILEWKVE
jgi:hypothetical protein